jgi:signal transduction histidine kinase
MKRGGQPRRKKSKPGSCKAQSRLETRGKERTAELHAANKELQREIQRRKGLEGVILEILDREQQRLGQELHDGLCQHLTAVAFMARAVALRLKNHRVIEVKDLEKISDLVNEAAIDARNMARGLHAAEVDSARLLPALRDLVSREIWKTPCRLEVKTKLNLYNDIAASHVYRLLREAVVNAHKHAQAKEIVVEISRSNGEIIFSVTDDGVGLPAGRDNSPGMGFHIMNSRARRLGGRLEIKRPQRRGTRVALYLPQSK